MAGKGQKSASKSKVKVGKLQVKKETVKDLTDQEAKKVKGGAAPSLTCFTFRQSVCHSLKCCRG